MLKMVIEKRSWRQKFLLTLAILFVWKYSFDEESKDLYLFESERNTLLRWHLASGNFSWYSQRFGEIYIYNYPLQVWDFRKATLQIFLESRKFSNVMGFFSLEVWDTLLNIDHTILISLIHLVENSASQYHI